MTTSARPLLRRACAAVAVAALAAACSRSTGEGRPEQLAHHGQALKNDSAPSTPPSGTLLQYFGGPVLSNVHAVPVFWTTGVQASLMTGGNNLDAFFTTILNSPYIDFLAQYDTVGRVGAADGLPGSNQTIGRGTETAGITLPSLFHTGTALQMSDVTSELQQQIAAGVLPYPDTNTMYFVYIPSTVTVTDSPGSSSCATWCGIHQTMDFQGAEVPFAVLGDMTTGGCSTGCGAGSTAFQHQTSVTSHELVEAITDTDVGILSNTWRPVAWYDLVGGEIGDLCNGLGATIGAYTVQQQFSNLTRACASTFAAEANTFGLSITPIYASIDRSAAQVFNVSTTVTSGSAESITLSASGLPPGVTATFGSTTITAGTSTSLTLSASASATYEADGSGVMVLATAPSDTQSEVISLDVCPTTYATTPINGDFQTGSFCNWDVGGVALVNTSGNYSLRITAQNSAGAPQSYGQTTFTLPAGPSVLAFDWSSSCTGTLANDAFEVTLTDDTTGQVLTLLSPTCANNATFKTVSTDVSALAGHSVTFTALAASNNTKLARINIDNVVVSSGTEALVNGNFEASTPTSGWTLSSGSAAPVASTDEARSPTHSLFLGSAESPVTSGTSTASQTVAIPATATSATLTFYAMAASLDGTTNDAISATVQDTTTTTTLTPLSQSPVVSTRAWTAYSVDVTSMKGHSALITFSVTNDATAGTATGMWIDDVSLVTH
jgi:hypothetical protein